MFKEEINRFEEAGTRMEKERRKAHLMGNAAALLAGMFVGRAIVNAERGNLLGVLLDTGLVGASVAMANISGKNEGKCEASLRICDSTVEALKEIERKENEKKEG